VIVFFVTRVLIILVLVRYWYMSRTRVVSSGRHFPDARQCQQIITHLLKMSTRAPTRGRGKHPEPTPTTLRLAATPYRHASELVLASPLNIGASGAWRGEIQRSVDPRPSRKRRSSAGRQRGKQKKSNRGARRVNENGTSFFFSFFRRQ
jgi:hypothetical protein